MENRENLTPPSIREENLDPNSYTASLLQECRRCGLLDEASFSRTQDSLFSLLGDFIKKATNGVSSSVPVESADEMMNSILLCIDTRLKQEPSPQTAAQLLCSQSIAELHSQGATLLDQKARSCEALLSRARATRIKTINSGYRLTLDQSLPQYLRDWKRSIFPFDFVIVTEYPIALQSDDKGIFGLHRYLTSLALENRFCARFSEFIEPLLCDYAHANRSSPSEAYVNLFSVLLQNLLIGRLLGKTKPQLEETDLTSLDSRFSALTQEARGQALRTACEALLSDCNFESPKLEDYVVAVTEQMIRTMGKLNGRISAFATVSARQNRAMYIDGHRLDNEAFSLVAEELRLCDTVEEKYQIIQNELRSLSDLRDMLDSGSIFPDEYLSLYALFDSTLSALLLTSVPVSLEDGTIQIREDGDWQSTFSEHLNHLPNEKSDEILDIWQSLPHVSV